MDGVCKRNVVYKDGCCRCKKSNVQLLLLFDDRFTGTVV
jgi:hypothetical protein